MQGAKPEKEQAFRVVKDLAEPLYGTGRGITTDNFFTSVGLANFLLEKKLTLLGTVRKNKPDTPNQLKTLGRPEHSSLFAFCEEMTMVSYIPKKGKMVHLLSTQHLDKNISEENNNKPIMILDYNSTKGSVDNADKMICEFTCARRTARWPFRIFMNIIDICALNAFILFVQLNPDWNTQQSHRRRVFLLELGDQLTKPHMIRRLETNLQSNVIEALRDCGVFKIHSPEPRGTSSEERKRARCYRCPRVDDKKSRIKCVKCNHFVCEIHRKTEKRSVCNPECKVSVGIS